MKKNYQKNPSWSGTSAQEQSKFQRHSAEITQKLKEWKGTGSLHKFQINAVLNTAKLLLKDESRRLLQLKNGERASKAEPAVVWAPTGSGKSVIIALLPYVLESLKVLVVTPSKVISNQHEQAFKYSDDCECLFEKIGLVSDDDYEERKWHLKELLEDVIVIEKLEDTRETLPNVNIINAQKFAGRSNLSLVHSDEEIREDALEFLQQFDTLIVDEAHHYPAKTWKTIVKAFRKHVSGMVKKIAFLTATPYRRVGGKQEFFLGPGKEDRIAHYIAEKDVVGILTRPCKFRELIHSATHKNVLKDILQIFKENYQRDIRITPQAMVLVHRKKEAKLLAKYMNEKIGIGPCFATAIFANNQKKQLKKFTRGSYQVAITCGVALEGYDNPDVVACVILRKIRKGRIIFQQFAGRCKRLNRSVVEDCHDLQDQSVGTVLSYREFDQRKLWDESKMLANAGSVELMSMHVDEIEF